MSRPRSLARLKDAVVGVVVLVAGAVTGLTRRSAHPPVTEPGHEPSDVSAAGVVAAALFLLVSMGVFIIVVSWIYAGFTGYPLRLHPPGAGIENPPQRAETAPPRLEVAPDEDLAALRADENRVLGTYGWSDRRTGAVRIPIARAMDLLAERGLPARTSAPEEPARPTVASSGRVAERRP